MYNRPISTCPVTILQLVGHTNLRIASYGMVVLPCDLKKHPRMKAVSNLSLMNN
jgi:hypothetical protein